MKQRRYRTEVPEDLAEAAAWYEQQQPGVGVRFLDAVEATVRRIEENPRQFRVVHRDFRRALLPRPFPYQVYFRVRGEIVEIFAVLHSSRHPDTWRKRGAASHRDP